MLNTVSNITQNYIKYIAYLKLNKLPKYIALSTVNKIHTLTNIKWSTQLYPTLYYV